MNATITTPKLAAKAKRTRLFFKAISYNGSTLVFAPPAMAEGHHKLMKALENSKTWREFRAAIAASDFKEIKQLFRERDECSAKEIRELTSDDRPFRADAIPGVEDGEYPSMIAGIQALILPPPIVEKYGKQWGAFNCSNICLIDVRHRDAILDETDFGDAAVERQDLAHGSQADHVPCVERIGALAGVRLACVRDLKAGLKQCVQHLMGVDESVGAPSPSGGGVGKHRGRLMAEIVEG